MQDLTDEEFLMVVESRLREKVLAGDVEDLDMFKPRLLSIRVERYMKLCKAREQYRHPKDKELTDFDRKTMLEAAVSELQADYELAKGLEELVSERVDLLKLLMRMK